jgi:hypothetical protein
LGSNFYRLKIWNEDQVFTYSTHLAAEYSNEGNTENLVLFPNPSTGEVNVSLKNSESDEIRFRLYKVSGELLRNEKWPAQSGEPFFKKLDLSALPNGLFYYELKNGEEKATGSLIIQ